MQYDVTALAERLMAQNTPDSTRAAELLTAQSASLASLREDMRFLKTLHEALDGLRKDVEDWREADECSIEWTDGVRFAMERIDEVLDRAPFSPEGLAND